MTSEQIIILSIETNLTNDRIEPGREAKRGDFLHHKTAQVLESREDDPFAIYIDQDAIAYTYYIHHQRFCNYLNGLI